MRIRCRAVLLDAGGVVVLPHRGLVAEALAGAGIEVEPGSVAGAHYEAVRRLDGEPGLRRVPGAYLQAFCAALGIPEDRRPAAAAAVSAVERRGAILWSEPGPHAIATMRSLRRAGIAVVIVTNSDGHAAENLRTVCVCQTGAGAGATVTDVIDSALVGSAKPDPIIFQVALRRARVASDAVVHVGDTVCADIDGAQAAGIRAIHLDPARACRRRDHRHMRSLRGIWQHIASWDTRRPVVG